MNRNRFKLCLFFLLALGLSQSGLAQFYRTMKGDPNYRAKNVHSGNQIRTTFFNYGFIGRLNPAEDFGGEWPINSGHFYVGDISVMAGAEVEVPSRQNPDSIIVIHPVTVADGPRGGNELDPQNPTIFWGWEPIPGFINPDTPLVAMSHKPISWPPFWPDKENDMVDPGWPGAWNGFFGKDQFNADQESYWWMDDSRDKEFVRGYGFYPDSTDSTRGGLALVAQVRGLQWSQAAAQNNIFWLYEITNVGTRIYDKTVFGMIVGTLIGGDGDSGDDNSFFDTEEDITYSWDNDRVGNTGWSPVGLMGYAFLESPGNALNGIDDDNDGADGSGPEIDEAFLQPRQINVGDPIVLIDYQNPSLPRTVTTMPAEGVVIRARNGKQFQVMPGDVVVESPFNNIDDNLNGIIDENPEIPGDGLDNNGNGLIDEENQHLGLKYIDYFTGAGLDNPMLDEARDDGLDNDQDWDASIDDVGLDGKPGTNDFGEGDGQPTSGYQPWGPNGELIDTGLPGEPNIDKTDVDESDQIGLTSFYFFFPFNAIQLFQDEALWNALRPGFFSVTRQNVDGDFIYGTGYFPLRPGQTERISLAFFFGDWKGSLDASLNEIFRTKETVQIIYNNNYNFARAPIPPLVKGVAGDRKATIYWDTRAEQSFDRLALVRTGNGYDFEGYKIYRATFPTFDETGVVTNAFGSRVSDVPIAQFDLDNDISGYFPKVLDGNLFYLGDNTGLVHVFEDTEVNNGFTYFYAVTSYDRGIPDEDIGPAESPKAAFVNPDGSFELSQNVVMVRPEAPAAGYIPPQVAEFRHATGDATGQVVVETIDPLAIKDGHTYLIGFEHEGAFEETRTKNFSVVDITNGAQDTVIARNPNLNIDAVVFDGLRLSLLNESFIKPLLGQVHWQDPERDKVLIKPVVWDVFTAPPFISGRPYPADYAVEIGPPGVDTTAGINRFGLPPTTRFPVNFRVRNVTENRYVKFNLYEFHRSAPNPDPPEWQGRLDESDIMTIFEEDQAGNLVLTYGLSMASDSVAEAPAEGDTLYLPVRKPFLSYDTYVFRTEGPGEDLERAKMGLDSIKVVPNPYVATAIWEPRNVFTSGRGTRSIHFIHLPRRCTIRIYNVRGELVDTIEHNSPVTNGTAEWDLLSKDRLDIAYGLYIYHVEAPGIGEKVGKFAIIK